MTTLFVPNPWKCSKYWVKKLRGDREYSEVYNEKRMDFLSDWYEHCVHKDATIKELHEKMIQLPPEKSDFKNGNHQARYEVIFEKLKACVIKACKKKGYTKKNNLIEPRLEVDRATLIKEIRANPPAYQPIVKPATTAIFVDKCL